MRIAHWREPLVSCPLLTLLCACEAMAVTLSDIQHYGYLVDLQLTN